MQAILSQSDSKQSLSGAQHTLALRYLSLTLAIHDRNELIRVFCSSNPDQLTQGIREAVTAFDSVIRRVHKAVNLSEMIGYLQAFLDGMLGLCKSRDSLPEVADFVHLLHKHQNSSHQFIHQVTNNDAELSKLYRDYCQAGATHFVAPSDNSSKTVLHCVLENFSELPEDQKDKVRKQIYEHTSYLAKLHKASAERVSDIMSQDTSYLDHLQDSNSKKGIKSRSQSRQRNDGGDKPSGLSSTTTEGKQRKNPESDSKQKSAGGGHGPGSFLAKWQDLLDDTMITPDVATGAKSVRYGSDLSVRKASVADVDGSVAGESEIAGETTEDGKLSVPAAEIKDAGETDDDQDKGEQKEEEQKRHKVESVVTSDQARIGLKPPDVQLTIDLLGPGFREALRERA